MQILDINTYNPQLFIKLFLEALENEEIEYIRVDNEVHFNGCIYRFNIISESKEKSRFKNYSIRRRFELIDDIDNYSVDRESVVLNKKMIKMQNKLNNRLVNTSRKK